MNKKILLALPMSVILTACAMQAADQSKVPPPRPKNCESITFVNCRHDQIVANPVININTNVNRNPINPPIVCVIPGTPINFRVTPRPRETTTVATVPKNPANAWMYATNSAKDPDKLSFTVPDPLPVGDYDYMVVTGDGFCVDPRIKVPPGG